LQEFPIWIEKKPVLNPKLIEEADRMAQNLILIGFMGTGKSTVARFCAQKLGWVFTDTDLLIELRLQSRIADVFLQHGEAYFRRIELETLREVLQGSGQAVATGGGIVTQPEALALLEQSRTSGSRVVWLQARPEVILQRVGSSPTRPLLNTSSPMESILDLLAKREKLYRQAADYAVDTSDLTIDQVVDSIIRFLDAGES